jgi:hypothetical protein
MQLEGGSNATTVRFSFVLADEVMRLDVTRDLEVRVRERCRIVVVRELTICRQSRVVQADLLVYFVNQQLGEVEPRPLTLFATVPQLQAASDSSSPFQTKLSAKMQLVFSPQQPASREATVSGLVHVHSCSFVLNLGLAAGWRAHHGAHSHRRARSGHSAAGSGGCSLAPPPPPHEAGGA